ncbi:uncharacterized protein LOC135145633 isoform X2 [Zophobas morio]
MGVHSDQVIRYHSGEGYPITNLQERALSVLGCRYVKDILIGSPWSVTADMIVVLKVDFFIAGTVRSLEGSALKDERNLATKEAGKFALLESESLAVYVIVRRIECRKEELGKKHEEKIKREEEYYNTRYKRTEF